MLFHCRRHSNEKKSEEDCDVHKVYVADLEFGPSSIDPFGIIGHSINIGECLDSHLNTPRVIQNTTIAIHEINNSGSE